MNSEPISHETSDGLCLTGVRWDGEGPPALFTPGNGFTVAAYGPALNSLKQHYRLSGLNLRGFGGGTLPRAAPSHRQMVDDLAGYLATLGEPAVVVGHSMGASLSLALAVIYPDLVEGVILLDPLILAARNEVWPDAYHRVQMDLMEKTRRKRAEWANRQEAEQYLAQKPGFSAWDEQAFKGFLASGLLDQQDGTVRLACPPWLEAHNYRARAGREMFEWAGQIRAPTVILHGEQSEFISRKALDEFTMTFLIGVTMTLTGSHLFPMERPGLTSEILETACTILGNSPSRNAPLPAADGAEPLSAKPTGDRARA